MLEKQIKLMVVFRKLLKSLEEGLGRNLKGLGVTITDYSILSILGGTGEIPMQKLGELVLLTSGNITYATNRLLKNGLLAKRQDHVDKRVYWVQLSSKGEKYLAEINKDHFPFLSNLLSPFSENEIDTMTSVAKKFGITIALENKKR